MNGGTKKCSKCGEIKVDSDFYIVNKKTGKRRARCKKCMSDYCKEYYSNNSDSIKNNSSNYYKENCEYKKQYQKKYYELHREKKHKMDKQYRLNNKEKINNRKKRYARRRRAYDYEFKIVCLLRSRLNNAINGNFKGGSAIEDLGCTVKELKDKLEAMFYLHPKTGERMTWENHGHSGWHIDHIVPLSAFDLTRRDHVIFALHYTNLQPLWAEENLSKGAKITV